MNTKQFIILFTLILASSLSNAQSFGIAREIDEFTGDTIVSCDWVTLNDPVWKSGPISYFKLYQLDGQSILHFKVTSSKVNSVDEGDSFFIKLNNGEILEFAVNEHQITSRGAGAHKFRGSEALGFSLLFKVSTEQLKQLSSSNVSKLRLETRNGYLEFEPEKQKYKKEVTDYFAFFYKFISR
ncbi:MAG: hypothetical protein DA408_19865 [Bacteroidetes bacterium]|nr:MAG: hypothetical protein C7N36_10440 [Bacteroidota bacterium]PTM08764.1 MAG: hypothetical protein DA408_19865 [Bacteroidota bacterium]